MIPKVKYSLFCFLFLAVSFIANAQVNVNTGGTPTNYGTLTAAFTAINNGTHTGSIAITLTANHTLTATASLNASGSGSANYSSITIGPNTNVVVSCSLANRMIILNGADNVTINGFNSSGRSLTFTNTHISGNANFYFTNSACNNTITNCTITSRTANEGTITFTGASQNNNGNTISYCKIGGLSVATSAGQFRGVYAQNSGVYNDCSNNIKILNNEIFDYNRLPSGRSAAIEIGNGHRNWEINNNKVYLTDSVTVSTSHSPIFINRSNTTVGNLK